MNTQQNQRIAHSDAIALQPSLMRHDGSTPTGKRIFALKTPFTHTPYARAAIYSIAKNTAFCIL
ncbi:MAG: hypothetical protein ABI642_15965 [Polaromonas sp.]